MPGYDLYSHESPIEEKIRRAGDLWAAHRRALEEDRAFASLLRSYNREIARTQHLMQELDVVSYCARCAVKTPGGSCCGAGIENWYDETILFINLLLGREIPERCAGPGDCFFLGPRGCRLLARHHFCVNYLCHRIAARLSPMDVQRLRAQAGKELFRSWELEQVLRTWQAP